MPHLLHQSRGSEGEKWRKSNISITDKHLPHWEHRERGKRSEEKRGRKARKISETNKFLVGERTSEGDLGVRAQWVAEWGSGASFSLFLLVAVRLSGSSVLPLSSTSFFSSSSLLLFSSRLPSQLPPWGLSSPSPSPPPWLPTSPGRCWEPPGCWAAGGCLAGSLHRLPRHLLSCWECREESATIVQSARSRCPTLRGRSSRTRGTMSTRTVKTWGCRCS